MPARPPLLALLAFLSVAAVCAGCGSNGMTGGAGARPGMGSTSHASLAGTWSWNDDVVTYRADGSGTYFRNGEVCYEFRWRVDGDVVNKSADRDSGCQGNRDNSYRFEVASGVLRMTHVGSGFQTEWRTASEPGGATAATPIAAASTPAPSSGSGSKISDFLGGGSAPSATAASASPIVGSWSWDSDVETFRANGTGSYVRNGSVCYEFRYTVSGDVVSKSADRDSGCQGRRDNAYRFRVQGNEMTLVHVGSSFETKWTRVGR